MAVCSLNPLVDPRWSEFVDRHPHASVFHTPEWLNALRLTYGYESVVLTTSPECARLANGVVFCRVSSWLTGRRLVSLPFADHCDPLLEHAEDGEQVVAFLRNSIKTEHWKYIEVRPRTSGLLTAAASAEKGSAFCLHVLDLSPALDDLFKRLQKSSIQRMIRRAEREGLCCEEGRSEALLATFYLLIVKTRRRHKLPPQPISWFRHLIMCFGDRLSIRVASKDGKAIAGILTLRHRDTLVYKYGCSDERYHHYGPMPFLFWQAIRGAKQQGLQEFDLGRSDLDNPGLITFKNRWGATASILQYLRLSSGSSEHAEEKRAMAFARRLFACMPDGFLTAAGKLLYRHIG